ncbi:MAG: hypothetical protein ACRDGW_02140 [Actinomycetota bacterium]
MRQLTPRARQLPAFDVHPPRPDPPTSRWRAGPTTFGPLGRLVVTAVVLAFAPWQGLGGFGDPSGALMLWWLLGWSSMAALVLRHVWRRERVLHPEPEGAPTIRERMAGRFPRLGRSIRIPPLVVLGLLALIVGTVVVVVWTTSDSSGRYYLAAIAVAGGTAALLALWNDL